MAYKAPSASRALRAKLEPKAHRVAVACKVPSASRAHKAPLVPKDHRVAVAYKAQLEIKERRAT